MNCTIPGWFDHFAQDLRHAVRALRRTPGFSFVVIVTLAVGLGTAMTMFNFYSAALLRPMPFLRDEDSLLRIRCYQAKTPGEDFNVSLPDLRDLGSQAKMLSSVLAVWSRTFVVAGDERPERANGVAVTATAFETLGVPPVLGRPFQAEDGKSGAPEVVLLSHELWQNAFGRRADIVGQPITVNLSPATVVGVMPPGFGFPINSAIWQPLRDDVGAGNEGRARRGIFGYARMAPGVTLAQAQAELDAIALRLERDHPQSNTGLRFRAFLVHDEASRSDKPLLQLLLGAAAVLLLIASSNVANLLLARSAARQHEMALRVALGAGRLRVLRQAMSESLVLGILGGLASLLVAVWEKNLLLGLTPAEPPYWMRFDTDWRLMAFAALAINATTAFCCFFPALQSRKADVAGDLKSAGRGQTAGRRSVRVRNALVVGQCALALVLLVAGALMTRSFLYLARADLGLDPEHVLTFRTGMPATADRNVQKTVQFYDTIETNLRGTPGVEAAGFVSFLPLKTGSRGDGVVIEGRPPLRPGERLFAMVRSASPGAFAALRLRFRRGRFFESTDRAGQPLVAVVDEAFVEKYFPREDPVGRRFAFDQPNATQPPSRWFTIIGVIGSTKQKATARVSEPNILLAMAQAPDGFMDGAVRVRGDPADFASAIHAAVRAARADTPAFAVVPMSKVVRDATGWERLLSGLFGSFAAIALFRASLGLYGVIAYSVVQRTREIGVRMALGARPRTIVAMILGQGIRVVALGLVLGLVCAWFMASKMAGMLHGVGGRDPTTFLAVPFLLLAVALLACGIPARRAAKIDPVITLRSE